MAAWFKLEYDGGRATADIDLLSLGHRCGECEFRSTLFRRGTEVDLRDIEFAVRKKGAATFSVERFAVLADPKAHALFVKLRARFGL